MSTDEMIDRQVYVSLLASVKERIHAAQYSALKQVNRELVRLY